MTFFAGRDSQILRREIIQDLNIILPVLNWIIGCYIIVEKLRCVTFYLVIYWMSCVKKKHEKTLVLYSGFSDTFICTTDSWSCDIDTVVRTVYDSQNV